MNRTEFNALSTTRATDEEFECLAAFYVAAQNIDKRELAAFWDKRSQYSYGAMNAGREILRLQRAIADAQRRAARAEAALAEELSTYSADTLARRLAEMICAQKGGE